MKQNFVPNYPVVMVERNYKGNLERFALTDVEFFLSYGRKYPDIPEPSRVANSYTIKPMVHLWYKLAYIGSDEWNAFFTDMDYIRMDLMESLTSYCRRVDEKVSDVRSINLAVGHLSTPYGCNITARALPADYWTNEQVFREVADEIAESLDYEPDDCDEDFDCDVITISVDVTTLMNGDEQDA